MDIFRRNLESVHCLLCGRIKKNMKKGQGEENSTEDYCSCVDVTKCEECTRDMKPQAAVNFSDKKHYKCTTHGRYREYRDLLFEFKNWCIVWVTIAIVPLGLVTFESGIDLNWIFYSGAIVTIPCFPPVLLSIMWVKATGKGLIIGEHFSTGFWKDFFLELSIDLTLNLTLTLSLTLIPIPTLTFKCPTIILIDSTKRKSCPVFFL